MLPQNVIKAPLEAKAVLDHASLLFGQGKYAEAATLYQRLLQTNLKDYATWGNLGITLRELKHSHTALVCLKRAIELYPASLTVLRNYAGCLRLLGRKDAHLAGSIGCPVWNLLSYRPYWLYLREREDSPWYPSMRLFRQPELGDWDSVFEKVAVELEKAVALKKSGTWTWSHAG